MIGSILQVLGILLIGIAGLIVAVPLGLALLGIGALFLGLALER